MDADDPMSFLKAGHSLSCVPLCALQAEVQPQCGRAVGFSSGTENPHGVKAVTRGQRCAIALWFTLDARHSERVRAADAAIPWRGPCSASTSPSPLADGLDMEGALCHPGHCLILPGPLPYLYWGSREGGRWGMTLVLGSSLRTTSAGFAREQDLLGRR